MSIVTQIQDLFPDLGAGFIVKCLDEYNDDIEQVTAHLLEDSLPAHLAAADRSEKLYVLPFLVFSNLSCSQIPDRLPRQHHSQFLLHAQANTFPSGATYSTTMISTSSPSIHLAFILAGEAKT